jgi:tRNA A37 methylthiotransferase MiaB
MFIALQAKKNIRIGSDDENWNESPVNFILLSYYHLRSFYKKIGKYYDKYKWFPCDYGWHIKNVQGTVDTILKNKIDVLCFSMYLWNSETQLEIAKLVKEKNPNIKIIIGGHIGKVTLDNANNRYPFIDYIIYGEGEKAFQMLLDSFYEKIDEKTIPNLLTKNFKTNYEFFKFEDYPPFNPILDLKDTFIEDYAYWNANKANPEKGVVMFYNRVRGCPYKCTFCAWGGGLHNKVNVRQGDWKEEIKFLSNYDIILIPVDANFGIYEEDIEFLKYALSLTKNSKFRIFIQNYTKLQKERVFRIWEEEYQYGKKIFRVSLQSMHEQVLANIDRPEIPWEKHKKMLIDFKEKHNDICYEVEIIHGLPGMNIVNTMKMLLEFADMHIKSVLTFTWRLLENSPADNKSYQEKHNLKVYEHREIMVTKINKNLDDLYNDVASDNYNVIEITKENSIYDSTITFNEYLKILYLMVMNNLILDKYPNFGSSKLDKFFDFTLKYIEKITKSQSNDWEEKLKQYGFIIFGFSHNNKTIPFDIYCRKICKNVYQQYFGEPYDNN